MNNNLTKIVLILDASGSMTPLKAATLEGINSFVATQKLVPGDATIQVVSFSNQINIGPTLRLNEFPINFTDYYPAGGTALLDAIGSTIDQVGSELASTSESNRPGKVIFVVITDGEENASIIFNREQVFSKINTQKTLYNWDFIYIGANQDAIQEGVKYGFNAGQSLTYNGTLRGTQSVYNTMSDTIAHSRYTGSSVQAFSNEQRSEAVKNTNP